MAGNDGRGAFPFVPVDTCVTITGVAEPSTNLDSAPAASRSHRGRPRGARNKPKPNTIIVNNNRVLDIQSSRDVVECLVTYARRCGHGFFILGGGGIVTGVKLRQPGHDAVDLSLPGHFEIVYLGGSILPPSTLPGTTSLTALLADGDGQLFAGAVVGPLFAVSNVNVTGNVFSRVLRVELPLPEEEGEHEARQNASQNPGGDAARTLNANGSGFYYPPGLSSTAFS